MKREQLAKDIQKFLDVYNVLTPQAKALFEVQLAPKLNISDKRSKKLYLALLSAAQDKLSIEEAISRMEEVDANPAKQRRPARPGSAQSRPRP